MISRLLHGLRQRGAGGTLVYALGRFALVRALWRRWRLLRGGHAGRVAAAPSVQPFDPVATLAALRKDSVFTGLVLRPEVLAELRAEVARAEGRQFHHPRQPVTPEMRTHNGDATAPTVIVEYCSPALQALAERVATDPCIVAAVEAFLGGPIAKSETHVQESLVVEASTAYREAHNQTVTFHYDIHGLGFLYVFFYLSHTDATNGAHEVIRGTHARKKLRHLLGSARRDDDEIYAAYGRERALLVEGPAGTGFVEDTSSFHRALAPVAGSRFTLQIRYS